MWSVALLLPIHPVSESVAEASASHGIPRADPDGYVHDGPTPNDAVHPAAYHWDHAEHLQDIRHVPGAVPAQTVPDNPAVEAKHLLPDGKGE